MRKIRAQDNLKVVYINRKGNTVAHKLVVKACSHKKEKIYFSTPNFLQAVIAAEFCTI